MVSHENAPFAEIIVKYKVKPDCVLLCVHRMNFYLIHSPFHNLGNEWHLHLDAVFRFFITSIHEVKLSSSAKLIVNCKSHLSNGSISTTTGFEAEDKTEVINNRCNWQVGILCSVWVTWKRPPLEADGFSALQIAHFWNSAITEIMPSSQMIS